MISELFHNPLYRYLLCALVGLYPAMKIFRRAGFAPWWAGMIFVPFAGATVCAGFLALKPWPAAKKGGAA